MDCSGKTAAFSAIVTTALTSRKRSSIAGSCSMAAVTQIEDLDGCFFCDRHNRSDFAQALVNRGFL